MKKVMGVVGVIFILLIFGLLSERPTTAQLDSVGRYQITSGVTREASTPPRPTGAYGQRAHTRP